MNKTEIADQLSDDFVTVVAILGIVFLGFHGIIDLEVISAVAGLGGYRLYKRRQTQKET
jgi:hypothetical protein